jgi:hypothetical protein
LELQALFLQDQVFLLFLTATARALVKFQILLEVGFGLFHSFGFVSVTFWILFRFFGFFSFILDSFPHFGSDFGSWCDTILGGSTPWIS